MMFIYNYLTKHNLLHIVYLLSFQNFTVFHFRGNHIKCGRYICTTWTINARVPAESSDFWIAFWAMQFAMSLIQNSGHPAHWFHKVKLLTRWMCYHHSRLVVRQDVFVVRQNARVSVVACERLVSADTRFVRQNVTLVADDAPTWTTLVFNWLGLRCGL